MSAASITPAPRATVRAARPRSALRALTRAEGRRLLRHPIFLLGMTLSAVILALATTNSPSEGGDFQQEIVHFLVGNCFLFIGAAIWTFLATFLASSRERRDGAQDFYDGQAVTPRTRTAAALLSVGYAGAAAAALVGIAALVLLGPDLGHGVLGLRVEAGPFELLQGPLYVVLAGVLGVSLGSWTRHVWIAVLAAVALFLPPLGLVPWLVFDQPAPRGDFGGVMDGLPPGWHVLAMAGLTVLAASIAVLRHDQRLRVVLLVCAALGATATVAIAGPSNDGVNLGCGPPVLQPAGSARTTPVDVTTGNFDFERGNLDGWLTRTQGDGTWRVYTDGRTPPDPAGSDPGAPFDVVDPPQGRFAAVTDMCAGGSRIMYRDVKLTEPGRLRFTLFHRGVAPFSSSQTLDHAVSFPNVQFRVDVMDPRAPVDSLAPHHILATAFRTTPGDDLVFGPRRVAFDLSPWAGRDVRIRFAEVDNIGPLRVVVDDVKLEPASP